MKVDNAAVAELEGLEPANQSSTALLLGQAGKDGVGGAAPVVQELDLLFVDTTLGHQVAGKDVKDAVTVQLDAEEEWFTQTSAVNVFASLVGDAEQDLGLGSGAIDHRGGDAGDVRRGGGVFGFNGSINIRQTVKKQSMIRALVTGVSHDEEHAERATHMHVDQHLLSNNVIRVGHHLVRGDLEEAKELDGSVTLLLDHRVMLDDNGVAEDALFFQLHPAATLGVLVLKGQGGLALALAPGHALLGVGEGKDLALEGLFRVQGHGHGRGGADQADCKQGGGVSHLVVLSRNLPHHSTGEKQEESILRVFNLSR